MERKVGGEGAPDALHHNCNHVTPVNDSIAFESNVGTQACLRNTYSYVHFITER
jgi:hypothetical protein